MATELKSGQTVRVSLTLLPLGRTADPASLDLRAAGAEPTPVSRPLYRRWELWAGVGAVVIAIGAVVFATSGSPKPFPCGGGDRVCAH